MAQVFYASQTDTFTWPNNAIGHRPGGPMDCLGPFAKVRNCPVAGTTRRVTAYASGYANTYFSIPANCKINGQYVRGYFTTDAVDGVEFRVMDAYKSQVPELAQRAE
jgi:hypothetical protein